MSPDISRAVITGPSHRPGARDGVGRGAMDETGLGWMARLGDGVRRGVMDEKGWEGVGGRVGDGRGGRGCHLVS